MKIVINKCFGGFGLSPKAVARLAELRGQKAYFFTGGYGSEPLTHIPIEEATGMLWMAYNTRTPTSSPSAEEWVTMTSAEQRTSNAKTDAEVIDSCSDADKRGDPLLVQVVEELGAQASGPCAKLEVVEIPDGVEWEIDEYDGQETIDEKYRSWR